MMNNYCQTEQFFFIGIIGHHKPLVELMLPSPASRDVQTKIFKATQSDNVYTFRPQNHFFLSDHGAMTG